MSSSSEGVLGELLIRGGEGVFSGVACDGEAGEGGGSFEGGGHGFSLRKRMGSVLDRWVVSDGLCACVGGKMRGGGCSVVCLDWLTKHLECWGEMGM